jgi:hypothetical protein
MAKLRDLITERAFGEPLPTFKGVMKQHQVNKLQEDWWDMLEPDEQAAYIKAHPGSEKAQGAKDEPEGKKDAKGITRYTRKDAQGREYDAMTGKGKGKDSRNEPDDEEWYKSMMSRTGKELNQETLMIDGKQYRRINEVEQEPKSKYEFAEFYKRFKK